MPDALPVHVQQRLRALMSAVASDRSLVDPGLPGEAREVLAAKLLMQAVSDVEVDTIRAIRGLPLSRPGGAGTTWLGQPVSRTHSWREIGELLGVTKQSVQGRFGPLL